MNAIIISAGQSLDLQHGDYHFLYMFARQLRLLGINTRLLWKTARNPMSLYHQISEFANSPNYLFIVNQMDHPVEDVAKSLICDWLSLSLREHPQTAEKVKAHCRRQGVTPTAAMKRYPMIPEGTITVDNPKGLAPGYMISHQSKYVIVLPHDPAELRPMLEDCMIPMMVELLEKKVSSKVCHAFSIGREELEEELSNLLHSYPVCFSCREREGEIAVTLTSYRDTLEEADEAAFAGIQRVVEHLQPYACPENSEDLADRLLERNRKGKLTITVAEALDGLQVFRQLLERYNGLFTYVLNAQREEVREKVMQVPPLFLYQENGVNREAAMHMARNAIEIDNTVVGLSVLLSPDHRTIAMGMATKEQAVSRVVTLPETADREVLERWVQTHILNFCLWSLESWPEGLKDGIPVQQIPTGMERDWPPLLLRAVDCLQAAVPIAGKLFRGRE